MFGSSEAILHEGGYHAIPPHTGFFSSFKTNTRGLREARQKLDDAVTDLTPLHVQTFSGKLKADVDSNQEFDKLRDAISGTAAEEAEVTLVAARRAAVHHRVV